MWNEERDCIGLARVGERNGNQIVSPNIQFSARAGWLELIKFIKVASDLPERPEARFGERYVGGDGVPTCASSPHGSRHSFDKGERSVALLRLDEGDELNYM